MKKTLSAIAGLLGLTLCLPLPHARAASYYWDTNGATAGFGTTSGTWGLSTFWSTDSTGASVPTVLTSGSTDDLFFGTNSLGFGAGTIAVSGTQMTQSIKYGSADSGAITLGASSGSGMISFGGSTPSVTNFGTVTHIINANLKTQAGSTLTLTGALGIAGNNNSSIGGNVIATGSNLVGVYNNNGLNGAGLISVTNGTTLRYWNPFSIGAATAFDLVGTGLGNRGAISFYASTAATLSGSINLSGNTSITSRSGTLTLAGNITESGGARSLSFGYDVNSTSVILSGSNSFSGGLTLGASSNANTNTLTKLTAGSSTAFGSGTLSMTTPSTGAGCSSVIDLNGQTITVGGLTGGGTNGFIQSGSGSAALTINQAGNTTFSGNINDGSGTVALTKSGAGTLTLTGTNTFSGGIRINGGTLKTGGSSAFIGSSAVTFADASGAALDLNGFVMSLGSLAGGGALGGNVILGSSTLTLGGENTSTTYAGSISGVGGTVVKTGTGTLIFGGANTYSGATTVNAGTLQLGDGSLLNGSVAGDIVNNSALVFANPMDQTYNGVISGTGGSLVKTGSGTLTLCGTNTYAGTFTINAGALRLGNGSSLNGIFTGNIINNSTLVFANATAQSYGGLISGAGDLVIAGAGTMTLTGTHSFVGITSIQAGAALQLGNGSSNCSLAGGSFVNNGLLIVNSPTNQSIPGVISGTGALTKTGSGTLTIGAFNLTGTTTLSGGTIVLGGSPTGSVSSLVISATSTLKVTASCDFSNVQSLTINSGAMLTVDTNGKNVTLPAFIAGSGGLTKIGAGTLTLSGSHNFSGTVTVNGGKLLLQGVSGMSSPLVVTSGSLVLSGSNSTTGNMTVNGGILEINSGAMPATGTITVNNTGVLAAKGAYSTVSAWLASGRISTASTGVIALATSGTSTEAINMTQGGSIYTNLILGATGTTTCSGNLTPVNGVYRMGGGGGTLIYTPAITGTGSIAIGSQGGYGTVVLSASNSFSGGSRVNGGTLKAGQANALGSGTITLAGGGGSANTTALDTNNTTITNPIVQTARTTVLNTGGGIGTITGTINAGANYFFITAAPGSTLLLSGNIVSSTSITSGYTGGGGNQPRGGLVILAPASGTNSFTSLSLMGGGTVRANDGAGLPSNAALILNEGIFETGANLARPLGSGTNGVSFTGGNVGFSAYGAPVTVNLGNGTALLWSGTQSNGLNVNSLILNGTNANNSITFQNPIDLNGLSKTGTNHIVAVNSGTATLSGSLSNSSGSAVALLEKTGSGTLVLTGTNTYNGGTLVSAGVLQFNSALAIAGTGANVAGSYGSVIAAGYAIDNAFLARISGSSAAGLTVALAANSSNNLDFSIATGVNLDNVSLGATGDFTYSGTLKAYGSTYCLGGGGGTLTMANSLTGTNSLVANAFGSGATVVLSTTNTYTGGNVVLNGAILRSGTTTIPSAPTYLRAALTSSTNAVLNWLDHSTNETGFQIDSSLDNVTFNQIGSVAAGETTYTATALVANSTYYFRVRAVNGATSSSNSNVASVSTQTPVLTAPTLTSGTADYLWVDLAWTNNATNNTGYVIQSSTDNVNYSEIARVPVGVPMEYSAFIGATQTTYFRVAAYDVDSNSGAWSNVVSADTNATADVETDLLHRFQLDDGSRTYNVNNPTFLPSSIFNDAQKQTQRTKMDDMVLALQAAVSNTNISSYTIPAGDYRLSGTGISISNRSNFTINTSGTVNFWYEGTSGGTVFLLTSCSNCTVQGPMFLDAENLSYTQGTILSYDSAAGTLDLEIHSGYSLTLPANTVAYLVFDTTGWQLGEFGFTSSQLISGRKFRLSGVGTGNGEFFKPGNILAFEGGGPTYNIVGGSNNKNMTYAKMTFYAGSGAPADTNVANQNTSWIDYRCIPQPGTNRVYTAWPGQFARNGGTLIFDGCEFDTAGDDGINLCSAQGLVVQQTAPRTLIVNRFTPAVGDTLSFYQYIGYQLEGTAKVTAVSSITDAGITAAATAWLTSHGCRWSGSGTSYVITLDQDVNITPYCQFYDSAWGADKIIVRNTAWRNMYAQGLLLQGARQVVVKNNLFQGNFGPAVAPQASQYWQEGKWPNNILIRNNISQRDGLWGQPAISVYPGLAYPSTERLIENVTIDGNIIEDPGTAGINVVNAKNVLIARNYISNPGAVAPGSTAAGITLDSSSNVEVAFNEVWFGTSGVTLDIYLGPNMDSTWCHDNSSGFLQQGFQMMPPPPNLAKSSSTFEATSLSLSTSSSSTGSASTGAGSNLNATGFAPLPPLPMAIAPANSDSLINGLGMKVDLQVRNQGESCYLGEGIYQSTKTTQIAGQKLAPPCAGVYELRIRNDSKEVLSGDALCTPLVRATEFGDSSWKIAYYDSTGEEITTKVLADDIETASGNGGDVQYGGWNPGPIQPGQTMTFTVVVQPEAQTPKNAVCNVLFEIYWNPQDPSLTPRDSVEVKAICK